MLDPVTSPMVQSLAWTLVHVLWQGAALGVLMFAWLRLCRPAPQARYAAGVLALVALLAAPVVTFVSLTTVRPDEIRPARTQRSDSVQVRDEPATPLDRSMASAWIEPREPVAPAGPIGPYAAILIVAGWATGVALLSVRLTGGWMLARRLTRRGTGPAPPGVHAAAAVIARRLGLTCAVRIVESHAVSTPLVVGWLKPVVVWPAAALAGLTPGQVEAVLAHELAHIRRHDYLVNLLQSLVETWLFYHPAVWFVSQQVRDAREQCCDDLVVGVCDRVVYAKTLADLAARRRTPRIALAATDRSLLARVQRILAQPGHDPAPGPAWFGALACVLVLGGMVPAALESPAPGGIADVPERMVAVEASRSGPGAVAGDVPEAVSGRVADRLSDRVPVGVSDTVPREPSGGAPGRVAPGMPDMVPGRVAAVQDAVPQDPPGTAASAAATSARAGNSAQASRIEFHVYETDHFEIFYYADVEPHLEQVARYAESAYQQIRVKLRHDLWQKVPLILLQTGSDIRRPSLVPGATQDMGAFAEPARQRIVVPLDEPPDLLYRLIVHELTHQFELSILPTIVRGPPLWVKEGLAEYMTGEWRPLDLTMLRDAVAAGTVPRMSRLEGYGDTSNLRMVYNLGHAAFEFIEERWGEEGVRRFLFALRRSIIRDVGDAIRDVGDAYREALQLSPDAFDREFDRYLEARFR